MAASASLTADWAERCAMRVGVLERVVLALDGCPIRLYADPGLRALWFSRDLDSTRLDVAVADPSGPKCDASALTQRDPLASSSSNAAQLAL